MNSPSQPGGYQQPEQPTSAGGGMPAAGQPVAIALPTTRPLVSYALIGFTLLVFLGQMYGMYVLGNDVLVQAGAMFGPLVSAGQYWRLITPVFLHASVLHFGVNMYSLYVLGPGLERSYGHARFLALYLIAGFTGNVISYFFSPSLASAPPGGISASIGASTAIFGLLAAYGVLIYQNRKIYGSRSRAVLQNILVVAAINLLIGFAVPGIDNNGHLGGIAGGLIFAWFAGPIWQVEGTYPSLYIVDRREPLQIWLTAVVVTALFAGIAFIRVMRG